MATQMQTGKAVLLLGDQLSDTTFILVQIASPGIQEIKYSGKIESEVEYRALVSTATEMTWIICILHDIGVYLKIVATLFCDNLGGI